MTLQQEDRQAALFEVRAHIQNQKNWLLHYENKDVWSDDDKRQMRAIETSIANLETAARLLESVHA